MFPPMELLEDESKIRAKVEMRSSISRRLELS